MPAKHSLHVVLTESLVRYVRKKVALGHHATISDVVRASLLASIELEKAHPPSETVMPAVESTHGN